MDPIVEKKMKVIREEVEDRLKITTEEAAERRLLRDQQVIWNTRASLQCSNRENRH